MGDPTLILGSDAKMLDPRVVRLWRWEALVWPAVLAVSVGAAGWLLELRDQAAIAAFAVMLAGVVVAIAWPPARYRSWTYAVRDSDVVLRRGVLWIVTSIVPHSRIQHVDTTHGPLERKLGLSSVVLFTAGTVGASMTIPGLPAAQAAELRDRLAALARTGEAV